MHRTTTCTGTCVFLLQQIQMRSCGSAAVMMPCSPNTTAEQWLWPECPQNLMLKPSPVGYIKRWGLWEVLLSGLGLVSLLEVWRSPPAPPPCESRRDVCCHARPGEMLPSVSHRPRDTRCAGALTLDCLDLGLFSLQSCEQ